MERTVALDPVAWGHVAQQLGPRYRSLQERIQQAIGQTGGSSFGTAAATRQADAGVLGGEVAREGAAPAGVVPLALNEDELAAVQEAADALNIPLPQ